MFVRKSAVFLASAAFLFTAGLAHAEEAYESAAKEWIEANVKPWLSDPALVSAIKAQNEANAALDQAGIDAADKEWRAEVDAGGGAMMEKTLGNAVSAFLKEKKTAAGGIVTEVFVMDNKGLNVGQSDPTSDYWQGDEDKFQKSFGAGAGAIFVDAAEKDESTQVLQSQVSISIADETGTPIGAITLGIDLDKL